MASNPATYEDVQARWRKLTEAEVLIADVLLGDAWALLKHLVPTLEARLDANPAEIDEAVVRMVLVAAVKREMVNPDRVRQEAIQDRSITHAANETGAWSVSFTDDELDLLAPDDEGTGDSFSIPLSWQVPATAIEVDPDDWVWRP